MDGHKWLHRKLPPNELSLAQLMPQPKPMPPNGSSEPAAEICPVPFELSPLWLRSTICRPASSAATSEAAATAIIAANTEAFMAIVQNGGCEVAGEFRIANVVDEQCVDIRPDMLYPCERASSFACAPIWWIVLAAFSWTLWLGGLLVLGRTRKRLNRPSYPDMRYLPGSLLPIVLSKEFAYTNRGITSRDRHAVDCGEHGSSHKVRHA